MDTTTPISAIVTHPGSAHLDDFLTVSILLAQYGFVPVRRGEPSPEQLADPRIAVVDVGFRYEPEKLNFDHHQPDAMAHPSSACCTFHQVVAALGLTEAMTDAYPWFPVMNTFDTAGPGEVAAQLGISAEDIAALSSPVQAALLQEMSGMTLVEPWLLGLMHKIGTQLLAYPLAMAERLVRLRQEVQVVKTKHHQGLAHAIEESPALALGTLIRKDHPRAAFTITPDGINRGWTIQRDDRYQEIDLSLLRDHAAIKFAHNNGFLAKTHQRLSLDMVLSLITLATQKRRK